MNLYVMLLVGLCLISNNARASLGDEKAATQAQSPYTVQTSHQGSVTIREYLSASGKVFATAWSGFTHPEMKTVLGSYYDEFHAAPRAHATGSRSHGIVRSENVVVETWGHLRELGGRAYDPTLLPAGVTVEDIQ